MPMTNTQSWGGGSAMKAAPDITAEVSFTEADMAKLIQVRDKLRAEAARKALKAMTAPELAEAGVQRQVETWRLGKSGDRDARLLWKQFKRWYPGLAETARETWKIGNADMVKSRKADLVKDRGTWGRGRRTARPPAMRQRRDDGPVTRGPYANRGAAAQSGPYGIAKAAETAQRAQAQVWQADLDLHAPNFDPATFNRAYSQALKMSGGLDPDGLAELKRLTIEDPDPAVRQSAQAAILKAGAR
jgi:hypothetical protein